MAWVSVDVGGTFTDIVTHDESSGTVSSVKVPSSPDDPARAVLEGVGAQPADVSAITRFRHGATLATNAVLERRGARLAPSSGRGSRARPRAGWRSRHTSV